MMKKILFLIVSAFVCTVFLQASPKINFRSLDVRSGLSDNFIHNILKDKYGFLWFATYNGLNRYDGYHFKLYKTNYVHSTYKNNIQWMKEDAAGVIWMMTPNGYYFYNRESDKIDNDIATVLKSYQISARIQKLFVDENQNLWCFAKGHLFEYDFRQKKVMEMRLALNMNIQSITGRKNQTYILLSDGRICRLTHHKMEKLTGIHIQGSYTDYVIYADSYGCLWIYKTSGGLLSCFSVRDKRLIHFPGEDEINNQNIITAVTDGGNGKVMIGTDNKGIFISNIRTKQCQHVCKDQNNMTSLPNNHISCLFPDNQGIFWVGTSKQGVAYYLSNDNAFTNCYLKNAEDVSCFVRDASGCLWMGFDGEGIARYDKGGNEYTVLSMDGDGIRSKAIVCSYLDSHKRIWWGSYDKGAFYYSGGQFHRLESLVKGEPANLPRQVRRIVEDRYGNIWFATYSQGLFCLDTTGNLMNYTPDNSKLTTVYIADLSVKDNTYLYIATSSGLFRMNLLSRRMQSLQKDRTGKAVLGDNSINCIYQDYRGLIWLGGREELAIYDKRDGNVIRFPKENGVFYPYSHIRAITEDMNHQVWLSTEYGVTAVKVISVPGTKQMKFIFTPYDTRDGIGNFVFNNFSILCNSQNELLVGGSGGYTIISANKLSHAAYHHKVTFTALYVADKLIEAGKETDDGRMLLDRNIQLTDHITLNYYDSNFSLELSALDFTDTNKLQYFYRMEKNGKWIKLDGNRIYFNKLSPGTYHLEVIVRAPGNSTSSISYMTIQMRPPFWLSIPAYIFYFILVVIVIWMMYLHMKRKHLDELARQKNELEVIQKQKTYEAKMRFFTNANHDLRTPLSLIILPLEKLMASTKSAMIKDDLQLMHRNATNLMNEIDQILDFQRIDQQQSQLSLSYGNICQLIEDTSEQSKIIASQRNILLTCHIPDHAVEMYFDHGKIQRIVRNLISNAIKYNCENGHVDVDVDQLSNGGKEMLRIQVKDTGIGIKDENKKRIFDRFFQETHLSDQYSGNGIGLNIVYEYVKLHGGEISVQDNKPQGSVFCVTLPIKTEVKEQVHAQKEISVEDASSGLQHPEETEADSNKVIHLLMVEDNDDFRNFMVNSLEEHFKVSQASDGQEALQVLEKENISIIISDVMMPGMDGLELCHRVKTDIRFSHIPVILLTARTGKEHIIDGLKEGADDYITKPFSFDILLLRIQNIMKWTRNNYRKFSTVDVSPAEITVSSLDAQLIEKAIHTVEENMDDSEFSVEDLSESLNMSRGHLYKKLMTITGKAPLEFIRTIRVKRGKQLLEQSQMNVSQIAYQIGLSPKQFAKYFREEFGELPSEYNKRTNK